MKNLRFILDKHLHCDSTMAEKQLSTSYSKVLEARRKVISAYSRLDGELGLLMQYAKKLQYVGIENSSDNASQRCEELRNALSSLQKALNAIFRASQNA